DALIQKVEDGFATPALVPIPKSSSLYPEGIQAEHNVEKAKLLVQQVGLKERPVLITPNTPTEGPLGEVIQAQLKEVGIDVELQKLEVPTFVERMFTKKDYGIGICGDTAGGDPDDLLYRYLNSKGTTNICNYEDPEVDRLLLQARQTYDPSTRKDLYRNVTQKLLEDAPIVYLYQAQRHSAIRSQAQNIVFKGDLSYDWREATVERK
ncbi:MAG TPA: hypothetical protein GX513_02560, partial [Firmicutes bacterium]|nr:hypothetical protein [Bacillota bacterium]